MAWLLPWAAAAQTVASGTCGAEGDGSNLSWTLDAGGTLTLSGTGEMVEYESSADYPWRSYRSTVARVVVGSGVQSVGDHAFYVCDALQDLSFEEPSSLVRIGAYAFYECPLRRYELPATVESIGTDAFYCGRDHRECDYLRLNQAMLDAGFLVDQYMNTIDTLEVADDVVSLNMDDVFENKNMTRTVNHSIGNLPDTLRTYQVPTEYDYDKMYWMQRRQNVYDVDGDGKMEYIGEDSYSHFNFSRFGFHNGVSLPSNDECNYASLDNDGVVDYVSTLRVGGLSNGYPNYLYRGMADGSTVQVLETTGVSAIGYADANADGLLDVVAYDESIYYGQPDGTYVKSLMQMVDTAAVDSIIYEQMSGSGLAAEHGIPSVATGMFVGNYDASDVYRTVDVVMDVDRNGWPDFLNLAGGNAWLNYGDNRFYKCSLGGQILAVKDLTGDGVPDYLIYDSRGQIVQLVCYDAGGHVMRRDLVQGLVVTAAWCYDFDRDGDADILLAFDYTDSQAYSVLIFCRNNGDGTFTRSMADEYFFPETLQFIDCVDIDNNGLYEVVGYDKENTVFRVIGCSDSFVATMQEQPLPVGVESNVRGNLFIGDLDGDGRIEYAGYAGGYMICKFAGAVNSAPQQMSKPSAVYDDSRQMLNVQWAAGSDAESSPVDLTYALRIGTEPGKGDILYAHALADGTRRNLLDGNMGHNLNHWVNVGNWTPGTYYIAVQAVDPNHRGGAWSEELVYEHAPSVPASN